MKNFKYLIIPTFGWLIIYLPMSLIKLTFDFSKWDAADRGFLALFGTLLFVFGLIISIVIIENK